MYINSKPEERKIAIIRDFIPDNCERILDLGCGNGLYGKFLKQKTRYLVGVDKNPELVNLCKFLPYYNEVHLKNIYPPFYFKRSEKQGSTEPKAKHGSYQTKFTVIWASEIIEHLPSLDIFGQLENLTTNLIIATLPNPLSPHFRRDSTHILEYSARTLKFHLKRRKDWRYQIYGLGFENVPIPRWLKKLNQKLLWHFPLLSPTILIVGRKN